MGFRIENNCVSCDIGCVNCGRREQPCWYCDECGDYADEWTPLYIVDGKELCEDCLLESLISKECDDCDDTLCANCGSEDETLYLVEGEWLCRDCVLNYFEKVDIEREDY